MNSTTIHARCGKPATQCVCTGPNPDTDSPGAVFKEVAQYVYECDPPSAGRLYQFARQHDAEDRALRDLLRRFIDAKTVVRGGGGPAWMGYYEDDGEFCVFCDAYGPEGIDPYTEEAVAKWEHEPDCPIAATQKALKNA